jgi:ribonuclease Y
MSEEEPDDPSEWESVEGGDAADGVGGRANPPGGRADASDLDERERELNKRERELEQREQEVLDRREETVERTEALDERERRLDERETTLAERADELDARAATLDERETEIDAKREGLQEYFDQGGADAFTRKPRVTAAFLLWATAVVGAGLAVATFLYGSTETALGAPLFSDSGALAVAALLGAGAVVELVGGFTTYYGRSWYFSVFAAIVAIVLLLPVGVTAAVMITVGESGFE